MFKFAHLLFFASTFLAISITPAPLNIIHNLQSISKLPIQHSNHTTNEIVKLELQPPQFAILNNCFDSSFTFQYCCGTYPGKDDCWQENTRYNYISCCLPFSNNATFGLSPLKKIDMGMSFLEVVSDQWYVAFQANENWIDFIRNKEIEDGRRPRLLPQVAWRIGTDFTFFQSTSYSISRILKKVKIQNFKI